MGPVLPDGRPALSAGGVSLIAEQSPYESWHGTTIVSVRKGGKVVIAGDGQVSIGQTVIKHNARKVRKLSKGDVIAGFAGATADAFTLLERLEAKLEQYPGPAHARLRRARQGLAHRPLSPPARGDDDRRRQVDDPGADRHRRRAGAGARHRRRSARAAIMRSPPRARSPTPTWMPRRSPAAPCRSPARFASIPTPT